MKPIRAIFAAFVLLLLTACLEEMSPLVAGTVSYMSMENTLVEKSLSQQQMKSLSLWLAPHSSDWGGCFSTPPHSTLRVSLKHADGTASSLALLQYENSQTTLRAQYLSGSNLSSHACAFQTFNQKDIASLLTILEVPQ